MAAPKGNEFWKARSSHGRKPIFETPEALWDACEQYFQWVHDNPLWEAKPFKVGETVEITPLPKMRAMTIGGLCIFLDIDRSTWFDYQNRKDYTKVTTRAEEVIRSQKFEGASADLLNANIIARDLGLADKQEHGGPGGGPVQHKVTVEFVGKPDSNT
ncbi:MAG: DNA-packaging protein [Methyloceanibacter sp.]|nr:DNA-packaging protein [Methyloceanibacter sp.]